MALSNLLTEKRPRGHSVGWVPDTSWLPSLRKCSVLGGFLEASPETRICGKLISEVVLSKEMLSKVGVRQGKA